MNDSILTATQREVAEQVLGEEGAKRQHLVVSLSGAHAYGFPSPDSDLDLKAIHVAPTAALLALDVPRASFDRMEVIGGVEIDYTSNELQMVLAGLLSGNGNYLERVLGKMALLRSPLLDELQPLARGALSRRYHRHYRGFARTQLEAAAKPNAAAKQVLYVLRTALTGTHLLRTGEVVTDLGDICSSYGLADAQELIAAKRAGEKVVLDDAIRERWLARLEGVIEALDAARGRSFLPEEAPNTKDIEAWLLEVRRRGL